jgi:GT2 family glycosyltransferase
MQLSVIIVSYNVSRFLEQCLLSAQEAMRFIDGEIIVVDNQSQDDSCAMVQAKFPKIKLIANKDNVGFAKANNQGVAIAKGDYVLILNPDTVLGENTLKQSLNYIKNLGNFGVLGVRLLDGNGDFLPESKRNIPTPKRAYKKLFFNTNKNDSASYYALHINEMEAGEVDVLVGAFMLISRAVYNEVAGFDEDFFMFGEDIDLSYRILKKGYKNYYYGKTSCIHYKGESTPKDLAYLKNFSEAMQLFYNKHFSHNILYWFFIKIGMSMWFWLQVLIHKKTTKNKEETSPKNILYIGNDSTFFNALKATFESAEIAIFPVCTSRVISKFDDLAHIQALIKKHKTALIIFDNTELSFDRTIFFMDNCEGINFKIRPKGTNYLIGSNSSVSLGKVIAINL